jgi:hypothetical protein
MCEVFEIIFKVSNCERMCVHGCNFAGVILWYALLRDGVEIYRDPLATSYTDNNAIIPYHTYSYSLEACNSAGCTKSSQVLF